MTVAVAHQVSSASNTIALELAAREASQRETGLAVLHVVDSLDLDVSEAYRQGLSDEVDRALAEVGATGLSWQLHLGVGEDDVATRVLELAAEAGALPPGHRRPASLTDGEVPARQRDPDLDPRGRRAGPRREAAALRCTGHRPRDVAQLSLRERRHLDRVPEPDKVPDPHASSASWASCRFSRDLSQGTWLDQDDDPLHDANECSLSVKFLGVERSLVDYVRPSAR